MHTFIFRWNYGLHCLLNISINFHTLPLCLISLSFALGIDPFQASMIQWSLWKHMEDLNMTYISSLNQTRAWFLEMCLGSESHGSSPCLGTLWDASSHKAHSLLGKLGHCHHPLHHHCPHVLVNQCSTTHWREGASPRRACLSQDWEVLRTQQEKWCERDSFQQHA